LTSAIAIASVTNNQDGTHATVVITGTPTGSLSFKIARTPNYAKAFTATFTGAGPYVVAVPNADGWYFWAVDNNGPCTMAAQWIGLSNNPEVDLVGLQLQTILSSNELLLNAALQQWYPNTTVKQIIYGNAAIAARGFPAIMVTKPRQQWQWVAMPYVKSVDFYYEVDCLVVHSEPQMALQLANKMAGAIINILKKPDYNVIVIPSGMQLAFCTPTEGEADENQVDDTSFGAVATVLWTGNGIIQDTGGYYS
jgi:hypothetical protein